MSPTSTSRADLLPPGVPGVDGWSAIDPAAAGLVVTPGWVGRLPLLTRPVAALVRSPAGRPGAAGATAVISTVTSSRAGDGHVLAAALVEAATTAEDVHHVARVRTVDLPAGPALRVARRRFLGDGTGAKLAVGEVTFLVPVPGRPAVVELTCSTAGAAGAAAPSGGFDDLAAGLAWWAVDGSFPRLELGACA